VLSLDGIAATLIARARGGLSTGIRRNGAATLPTRYAFRPFRDLRKTGSTRLLGGYLAAVLFHRPPRTAEHMVRATNEQESPRRAAGFALQIHFEFTNLLKCLTRVYRIFRGGASRRTLWIPR